MKSRAATFVLQGELADAMEQAGKQKGPSFTRDELKALFSLNTSTSCETATIMQQSVGSHDWQVGINQPHDNVL
jgi:hypothetical protein